MTEYIALPCEGSRDVPHLSKGHTYHIYRKTEDGRQQSLGYMSLKVAQKKFSAQPNVVKSHSLCPKCLNRRRREIKKLMT